MLKRMACVLGLVAIGCGGDTPQSERRGLLSGLTPRREYFARIVVDGAVVGESVDCIRESTTGTELQCQTVPPPTPAPTETPTAPPTEEPTPVPTETPTPVPTETPTPLPTPTPPVPPTPTPAPLGTIVGYGSQAAKGWESWPKARVTSVLPSGFGSLQAVLAAVPAGTVLVFDKAGTITLPCPGFPPGDGSYHIYIDKPRIVIDGLSAPAPGITLQQPKICDQDNIKIKSVASDVVIQGLRFRGPYPGGVFKGTNNQALPAVDGDSKPAGTIRNIVFYRNTFVGNYDSAPDLFGRVMNATIQANLWLGNRHPESVTRPSDQGPTACKNVDGSYCHPDGVTWYRNAWLENFERQPKIVVGDHLEYVNNVVHAWGAPNPTEGGGVGLQINPKSGPQYLFGTMNIVANAFLDAHNRPDAGCLYGDIPKGQPSTDGSKARAWLGNGGMVSRIFVAQNLLPVGRLYTKYNCATTPGANGKPFIPPGYAQLPFVSGELQLEPVIFEAGMPWPDLAEQTAQKKAQAAFKKRTGQ